MSEKYDLSVIFRVFDKASVPLAQIGQKFKQMTGPINEAAKGVQEFGEKIKRAGEKIGSIGQSLSLKLTLPLTLMVGMATKASIDFESAFTGVRKTVEATEAEFAALEKGLMGLARTIPLSTQEIFKIAESAGQLGIETENIQSFAKVMADLGVTTNLASDEAASQLARFANIVGMSQDKFDRLGSVIVDLGNNFATTEAEIVEMGMRLAGAGHLVKMSEAQIMGLSAALTSVGINAEAGGTAFSQVMHRINKDIGLGGKKMKGFATISGMTIKDFEKLWKENAAEAVLKFTEGLGKWEKKGANINQILDALGMDAIRISDALLRASSSGDLFRKAIEKGSKAWEENIALTKEANLRYATTASQLKIAWNKVTQLAAAFGDILKRALIVVINLFGPLIDWLTELHPVFKIIIIVIGALIAAIGPLLIALGPIVAMIGLFMSVWTPALAIIAATAATIGGIVLAFGILIAIIATIAVYWQELTKFIQEWGAVIILVLGLLTAPISAIVAGFALVAAAAFTIMKNWEPIKSFFSDLFGFINESIQETIGLIDKLLPTWLKKKMGFEIEENVKTSKRNAAFEQAKQLAAGRAMAAEGGINKSETDINIKVTSDQGSTATIEKVKPKKGDAKVNIATVGYVGAYH